MLKAGVITCAIKVSLLFKTVLSETFCFSALFELYPMDEWNLMMQKSISSIVL
jgi:hypothetical protein